MSVLPLVALVGNPNAGKSALFNALTGARQKLGNYPGVTVERKAGRLAQADGRPVELVDLPGTYSLNAASPDEQVTRDVVMGRQAGERQPDALVIVVDASNLDNHLRFALELIALGLPTIVALNMVDLATRDGLELDAAVLSRELGVPVIATVAVRKRGLDHLREELAGLLGGVTPEAKAPLPERDFDAVRDEARRIARAAIVRETPSRRLTAAVDRVALHPVFGLLLLLGLLFVMFQAVYAWSEAPIAMIEGLAEAAANSVRDALPDGMLRSFLVDGVINGVGSVVVFLPQILILFFFILMLEATGYMVRAAFLMDGLMARVGLSGRAFIPLLSSFACAIPGIMATRTIADPKDRLTTILIAPLMTCSARLPVYAVIIGAFIPARDVLPGVGLQGFVLFCLYISGIIGAMLVALILRMTVTKGASGGFLMEMPKYQWPRPQDIVLGLWQRAIIFLKRAGTIIFTSTVILWVLLSYPKPPEGSAVSQVDYSIAGRIAGGLNVILEPIGFNRDISLALIPAMAAREVAVSALATVYSIDAGDDEALLERSLGDRLKDQWPLPTALAFLAWFIFAPQCISTIAVTRRETNGWKWPLFMVGYLFVLAYVAAGLTYWTATAAGL
ncbi:MULTISPECIES: ferrous iron transporter B [unclassified Sphingobium]|uniref:ferrous iron transporter B n=1 Tax=unclassified Sphingobium TaxID=2611147 RepID=UPI000D153B5F|nr:MULTISPECIES: ferrous iron transporter B [unclassified Sphingobium]MBG6117934.1 ferrous iron transport protein B [Sphingobium sp. JAI105]PSO12244.1 ferrous iron transporter B [Sphingobium sp. AEW4]TWD08577.1 ferrous iron transport protein B [Sphingobium sp. AEW010]TWD25791.1 ferrous iron transport protein B [Sphingobium sp. AEW013]TWD28373.1 ferrous iron transport protein B [Sphingobium sp. AEW001]